MMEMDDKRVEVWADYLQFLKDRAKESSKKYNQTLEARFEQLERDFDGLNQACSQLLERVEELERKRDR